MFSAAFVSPSPVLKSRFLAAGLPTPVTCGKSRAVVPSMRLGDVSSGAKALLVAGVLTVGAVTLLPQISEAGLFEFSGERPKNIGLRYERYLDNCPASPNCVSSMANVVGKTLYSGEGMFSGKGGAASLMTDNLSFLKYLNSTTRISFLLGHTLRKDRRRRWGKQSRM